MASVNVFRDFEALLSFAESEYRQEVFLSTGDRNITFWQFCQSVRALAEGLVPGATYVLRIRNPILYAHAFYACVLAGAVAYLSSPEGRVTALPDGATVLMDQDVVLNAASKSNRSPQPDPEALCAVAFSSGTTAEGKGIMLSQKNLLTDTAYSIDRYRFWRGERILHVLPYHHLFGLVADLLAPLHAGAQVHFPAHPLQALREALVFRPNAISIPPAYVDAILAVPEFAQLGAGDGGTLKKLLCSGAALSEQKSNRILQLGILPCTAYGLTECSPCITITEDSDVRPGTVGREIGCVRLSFSKEGEIRVAGDTVMLGYYRNPSATRQKIRDGWLYTGDLGYRDANGHIVLTGRRDHLLVLPNGMNCSPEVVEEQLMAIDGIRECVLLQAQSAPDEIAVVVVRDDGAAVDTALLNRILLEHGIERYAVRYRGTALPKNLLGKVIRKYVL